MKSIFDLYFTNFWENFEEQMSGQITDLYSSFQEKDGKITTAIDLPGVKKEDLEVHLNKYALTIKATRKDRSKNTVYSRTLQVPFLANLETLDAVLADGVLTISFNSRDTTKALEPKKINVR